MTMSRLTAILAPLAFATLLAACGCGSKPAGTTPTGDTGTGSGTGSGTGTGTGTGGGPNADDVPTGTMDLAKLGSSCGDGDRCEAGSCTTYYGIAGPNGPAFKSCEVACANGKGPCPAGTACITIADGPGAVCRPTEANPPVEP
jgi:hypothetical protein